MKSAHLVAAALSFVLLTACIRIDVTQMIDKTGIVKVEMLYDLSEMAEMSVDTESGLSIGLYGDVSSSSSSASAETFTCAVFQDRDEANNVPLSNVRCTDKEPNVILLTGTQKLRRSEFIKRKSGKRTVYIYKIHSANKLVQSQQNDIEADPSVGSGDQEAGKEIMDSILQGSFTIVMPGRIVKAPGGTVNGNSVTFKITDFPLKRSGFIQSEE